MKKTVKLLCLLVALFLITGARAQLSGTYNVPSTFTSVAAAINSLNVAGVSGAVTIEVTAGYTETVTAGGFTLGAISGASSANTITFMKTGSGANPMLVAYTGGTAVPSSDLQDGVWKFIGSDYITIDGIDISDPNTTNPATMEFGYGFFKASATDGCQNNTIMNCHITLNRANNDFGSSPASDGSRGIDVVNAAVSTHTTAVTVTSVTGANSNNKFYTNIIENCNIGIAIAGYADSSPFTYADTGNDIGGTSASTGNMIINYGGGGTVTPAAGVRTERQYNINVSYNTINSNNGSGVNHAQDLRGIYLNSATSANASITNNTITVAGGGDVYQLTGIQNASGSTAASNSIIINNNLITGCTYTSATIANFYGLYSSSSAAYLSISNNTLTNNATDATDGSYYNIYSSGAVTTTIDINNNSVDLGTFNASTNLVLVGVRVSGSNSSSILNVNTNTFQSANFVSGGTGEVDIINNSGSKNTTNMNGNNFNNISLNTAGYVYLIKNNSSTPNTNASNNVITTGFVTTGTGGGRVIGYYNYGTPSSGTASITANNFSNISLAGSSTFFGIWQATEQEQLEIVNNNLISNVTGTASTLYGINHSYGDIGSTASNNTITALNGTSVYGLAIGYNSSSHSVTAAGNMVYSLTATDATGEAIGITMLSAEEAIASKNKVYNINGAGTGNFVSGLYVGGGSTVTVVNNLVGDIYAPTSTGQAVSGIFVDSPNQANIYYNTINISGTSSGSDFSSMALYSSDSPTLDLRNNIAVNNATATGTGATYAYLRSSSDLTNMALTSNNNLYYAGTPSSANLLYYDGTNSSQTISAYKLLMGVRETFAVTENPPFASTSGATANYLDLSTSVITLAESGALPITGITTDFGGNTRNVSTPDIGAWEGNYLPFVCTTAVGGTLASASASACVGQTLMASSNNVSFGIGTTYTWKVGAASGGPYVPITGGSGANTPNYTSGPLSSGVYYVVLETACPALSLTAISNEGTLTVYALPSATAAASSASLCAGQNFSLTGTGTASNFSWSGPNGYTSISQNPSFAIADATISGTYMLNVSDGNCTSATSTVFVKVFPYPATPTITALSASICPSGSTTLNGAGIVSATPILDFGSQESTSDASGTTGYPSPYNAYYGGQKMQMIVLASELYDAGFVAGSALTSIDFPVVSLGSNWGSSITENQNFEVSIGTTTLTSIPSNFVFGLTNVVAPSNFTPAVGYGNAHNFSNPFIWNGSENIIIETSFSNNFGGTSNDLVAQYYTSTSFESSIVYRQDYETAQTVLAAQYPDNSYYARPDFKLNGTSVGSMAWSPLSSLSGVTDQSVTASPAATTVYSLTASLGGCATTGTVELNVLPVPVLTVAASSTAICVGNSATLTVSGATSYSWNATTNTNTISVNPTSTTVYTVFGQNMNCAAVSETISITTNSLPIVAAAPSSNTICSGQTATLTASGASTYVWVSGPSTSTYAVNPTSNTTYSVTGTSAEGCSGQTTVSLTVNSGPAIIVLPATASVCVNSTTSFSATGASTYSWTSGGNASLETITVTTSGVYTVTGITNGCSTSKTVAVTALSLPAVNVSPASPTICTNESVILTASGGATTYSWTSAAAAGSTLMVNPTITSSYTVEGTDANNCSNKTVVTVIVDACTGIGKQSQILANVSMYPNPSTGKITANFGFEGKKDIVVLNSVGALILETSTQELSTDFDLSGFAKGVYFVNVKTNGISANYKIVIQ